MYSKFQQKEKTRVATFTHTHGLMFGAKCREAKMQGNQVSPEERRGAKI